MLAYYSNIILNSFVTYYSQKNLSMPIPHPHTHIQMADFLEGNFLTEQVEAIKELGEHITNLKRVGPGHGEYHFDRKSLK